MLLLHLLLKELLKRIRLLQRRLLLMLLMQLRW